MKKYNTNKQSRTTLQFIRRGWLSTPVGSLLCIAMVVNLSVPAFAEPWDNSRSNPYVAYGYGDQCTAYAWGRFKVMNGTALTFVNPQGKAVYPDAGLMYDEVVESPTVYHDSVPVRGSLISWTIPGEPGHTGIVEQPNTDGHGSCFISEQNWPTGWAPNNKTLYASDMLSRSSTNTKGVKRYFTLHGYVNPNRPPAFGTLTTSKVGTTQQAQFNILDEDRRQLSLISAIFDGQTVVSGTTITGSMASNIGITAVFRDTSQLRRGRTYTVQVWATDFRGLRSTAKTTFTW